ncbi:MAG: DUF1588 domain-containing protein [Myxococcota bacterium]
MRMVPVLVFVWSACDRDPDPDPTAPEAGACDPVRQAFDRSCTTCHSGAVPAGGLDLGDPTDLVGRPSSQAPLDLVTAGSPDDSYLWHKLAGTHGDVGGSGDAMPPPGAAALAGTDRDAIRAWIAGGAACDPATTDPGTEPVDDSACRAAQDVVDANCTTCHGESSLGALDLRSLGATAGAASRELPGALLVAPGDRDASYLWHKLQGTHLALGGSGVAMPPVGALDQASLDTIGAWIDAGASCVPVPPPEGAYDPNELDQDSLFVCDGSPSSSQARIRRLDDIQWRSTIGQSFTSPAASNPLGAPAQRRFSTYQDDVGMDSATLDLYLNVVAFAGGPWTAQYADDYGRQYQPQADASLRCMFEDDHPDAGCVDTYLSAFLEGGAYYRPPTAAELDRLRAFTEDALSREASEGWTREESLLTVTSAAWLTTGALFATALGDGVDADGRTRLTDWEQARLVSDLISDRALGSQGVFRWALGPYDSYTEPIEGAMPDLQAAAADGTIRDPAVAAALLRQYAAGADPARVDTYLDWGDERRLEGRAAEWMASRLDRFFLEFFQVESFPTVFKDRPEATSEYDGDPDAYAVEYSYGNLQDGYYGHESTMLQQFEDTIARIVVEDHDVLRELLTTRRFFLASTTRDAGSSIEASTMYTNRPYGYEADVGNASTADRWVTLPDDERAGLLTHPAWLATHGDAFEDGPSLVARGHWIREHLLCETVPPLEFVTVPALLAPSDGTKTARERVDESIEGHAECMVCHQSMNSLGRPFEIYNHAGFLRADDHGHAPDGSTTVENAPDPALNGDYDSAIAFTEALAEAPYVKRCFVRQTFRFFAGRDETLDDACVLSAMEQAYDADGSFLAMLEVLATHDAQVYRHVTEEN